ncbi:MAG: hypothetical protein JNK15_05290 [Planctomycetes bacterium]|nr:hypothetical protein [Planctomycetota bacterium]
MDPLRKWIVGLAAACFSAGAVVGHTFGGASAASVPFSEQAYADQLVATYVLNPSQQRALRAVLQRFADDEIAILRSAQENQLPAPLLAKILQLRNQTEQRIRALLDEEQRARYDRDSRPGSRPAAIPSAGDGKR